ncbi:hypothetical protein B9Z55_009951 [Caenorhabditis nigoni]|nr:hypothetical protein B9Z55_009951 [Caenorhabditis nigoni]
MKRNNEGIGGEGVANSPPDDTQQKRRRIQFEAVKMPAVNSVTELRSRTVAIQAAKLRQTVLIKNKRISDLERENERAKRRQLTDESNFLKVYNLFSELERFIWAQTKDEFGEVKMTPSAPAGTDVQGMTSEQYHSFVDTAKGNLRIAFNSYAKARHDRTTETANFIARLKTLIADPKLNINEIHKELAAKTANLLAQIDKLQAEAHRVQSENHNLERKRRHMVDKNTLLESRIQEMEKLLEEAHFETEKQMRLACKYEARLILEHEAASGNATASSSGTLNQSEKKMGSPGSPPSESTSREIEALRADRDEQAAIAARRLQELEDTNRKLQSMAQDISKLKMELQTQSSVPSDVITNSEEYRNLKKYYSLAIKEHERICKDLEDVTVERDQLRSVKENREKMMTEEHQKTIKEIQHQSEIHNTFYRVSHDSEVLRAEFETVKEEYNKTVKQSEWDEMKATVNTLRSLNKTMKSQMQRMKDREKASQKEHSAVKTELKTLKDQVEKSVLVPLEDSGNTSTEDPNKIRAEYESLKREIRRIGAMDKQEKQRQLDREIQRHIADKVTELETLRKTNEALTNDEQTLSDELENICLTIEEEQERNAQLFMEKRDQEDRNLKMMNERMIQNQVQSRMREKLDCLESKAQTDAQIAKMHEFEKKASDEVLNKLTENLQFKTSEVTRLSNMMEVHRKQTQELGFARDENQVKVDRCEAQLKQYQELYGSKSREVEEAKFKRQRAEEELELVRVKYERAKRNDSAQTGDQVLQEANRQMKETLTCPSCKTRPKDCIMLKCYHLFCETCIKTMYDTRQRKCPKCNSNFGANDFHRIFI